MSGTEAVIFTQAELEACCAWWQAKLRLRDWQIRVEIARTSKFRNQHEACGECAWFAEKKMAHIRIADPECYYAGTAPEWHVPQDMEKTLVHELLHIHFAEWPGDGKTDRTKATLAEEQAIEAIADALVSPGRWPRP